MRASLWLALAGCAGKDDGDETGTPSDADTDTDTDTDTDADTDTDTDSDTDSDVDLDTGGDCEPQATTSPPTGSTTHTLQPTPTLTDADADLLLTSSATISGMLGARDLTGDGVADIVVSNAYTGYPLYDDAGIYFIDGTTTGQGDIRDLASVWIRGDFAYSTGWIVSSQVADIDGDGARELLAYAYDYSDQGQVLVFDTPVATQNHTDATSVVSGDEDLSGSTITVGDVDGDGLQDLISGHGSSFRLGGQSVVVHAGGITGDRGTEDVTATLSSPTAGPDDLNNFGRVLSAGDLTGDGIDDIVVVESAHATTDPNIYSSSVYVFEGPITGDRTVADARLTLEEEPGSRYELSSAAVGDFNGDCIDDLVLGSYGSLAGGGKVYVVYGPIPAGSHLAADVAVVTLQQLTEGGPVVTPGDLDGDGFEELLIQDPVPEDVIVVFGPIVPDSPPQSIRIQGSVQRFGRYVGGMGDLNGDGFGDFHISSSSGSYYDDDSHRVYIFHGRADLAGP